MLRRILLALALLAVPFLADPPAPLPGAPTAYAQEGSLSESNSSQGDVHPNADANVSHEGQISDGWWTCSCGDEGPVDENFNEPDD